MLYYFTWILDYLPQINKKGMNGLFCISTIITDLSNKENRLEMSNIKCQNEFIRSIPSYDNLWDETDLRIMQKT